MDQSPKARQPVSRLSRASTVRQSRRLGQRRRQEDRVVLVDVDCVAVHGQVPDHRRAGFLRAEPRDDVDVIRRVCFGGLPLDPVVIGQHRLLHRRVAGRGVAFVLGQAVDSRLRGIGHIPDHHYPAGVRGHLVQGRAQPVAPGVVQPVLGWFAAVRQVDALARARHQQHVRLDLGDLRRWPSRATGRTPHTPAPVSWTRSAAPAPRIPVS